MSRRTWDDEEEEEEWEEDEEEEEDWEALSRYSIFKHHFLIFFRNELNEVTNTWGRRKGRVKEKVKEKVKERKDRSNDGILCFNNHIHQIEVE